MLFLWRTGENCSRIIITKTHLFKCIGNFTTKNWNFSDKNSAIFHTISEIWKIKYTPDDYYNSAAVSWYCLFLIITKTCLFKSTENFTTKEWKFSDKKFWYCSYFCLKYRLRVLARTTSIRKIMYTPVKPRKMSPNAPSLQEHFYIISK